jgi:quercetin dioxygenase-like cupin family protein
MRDHSEEIDITAPDSNTPRRLECGVFVDLNQQVDGLFSDSSAKDGSGRKTKMLVRYAEFRIALVTMKSGSRWDDHQTPARICVQVLRGKIRFHIRGGTFDLSSGQLLALDPGIVHSVDAVEDSAFLLTLCDTARQ